MLSALQKTRSLWQRHYQRERSLQIYPDENLVRLLKITEREGHLPDRDAPPGKTASSKTASIKAASGKTASIKAASSLAALDLGCGMGRHIRLLQDLGYAPVYGSDISSVALDYCRQAYPQAHLFELQEKEFLEKKLEKKLLEIDKELLPRRSLLPFDEGYFSAIILWGVLHYNSQEVVSSLLTEAGRLLADDGFVYFTLRASADTHFSSNADLKGGAIHLYSEREARQLLASSFSVVELGYSERSPLDQLERRICHWFGRASKPLS